MTEFIVKVTGLVPDAIYERASEEIVRCRDCAHFRENAMYGDSHTWCEEAPHFGRLVPPDGYCHRGVRRDGHDGD